MQKALQPLTGVANLREIVREFNPNWFTVTMGTGIVSIVMNQIPLHIDGLFEAARVLWLLNIALFVACSALFIARTLWFPETIRTLLAHPVQSMFLGAIPMGLATLVNGFVAFSPSLVGGTSFTIAQVMWWGDAVLAVTSGLLVPYMMFTEQDHALERMTAVWLLPIVPAEVTAASAGQLAPHLIAGSAQLLVAVGAVLWALSVPLAIAILAILFLRLALHKVPPAETGVSTWLTLGPLGTGALGMILLGEASRDALAATPLASVGAVAFSFGIIAGLLLWAYGLWWWTIAIAFTLRQAQTELPFNMGWWGLTFPLGVYTAATFALARATGAELFAIAGTCFAILLLGLYAVVAWRTAHGLLHPFFITARLQSAKRLKEDTN
jgi:C4-dicarboxylate transporter/malic acid transport protein